MGNVDHCKVRHSGERASCHFGIAVKARAVLAGVLSCFCAVSASPSGGPAAVSQPPASTSAPVMLGEIFERQLSNLATLQVQLDALLTHNAKLQSELEASSKQLNQAHVTLTELRQESAGLRSTLSQSKEAETALQSSLRSSSSLLTGAQSSLKRAERDKWVMMAAALAAGAILGGLLL